MLNINFLLIKLRLPYLIQTHNYITNPQKSYLHIKGIFATTLANTSGKTSLSHQPVWGKLFQQKEGNTLICSENAAIT